MNKTIHSLIFHTCIAIIAWGGYVYAVYYIDEMNTASIQIKQHIVRAEQDLVSLRNVREAVKSGADQSPLLDAYVVHSDQPAEIVQKLESYGQRSGIKVTTQSVNPETSGSLPEGAEFLKINLVAEGSLQNILNYSRIIETLPYNVRVNKMTFNTSLPAGGVYDANGSVKDSTGVQKWNSSFEIVLVKFAEKPTQ